jgi:hypothetical protein
MNMSRSETDAASRREYWAPLLELSAQEVSGLMLGEHLETAAEPVPDNSLDVTSMVGLAGFLCGLLTLRCSSLAVDHESSFKSVARMSKVHPDNNFALSSNKNMASV